MQAGADNVKDVPLAGGRQVDLMATFSRSPPVHQWTLSPLSEQLAAPSCHSGWLQIPPCRH